MTREQAEKDLLLMKRSAPYREWFAVEVAPGDWLFVDSLKKVRLSVRRYCLNGAPVMVLKGVNHAE